MQHEHLVYLYLAVGVRHLEGIAFALGLTIAEAARALLHLELREQVRRLPGERFERREPQP
jgi:hypothetical protein